MAGFEDFFVAPEGTTGTAREYMGQVGDYNIGQQPGFTVPYTTSAAPAQGFTATETGYTPTFDFSQFTTPTLPSYGYPYTGYQAPTVDLIGPSNPRISGDYPQSQQLGELLRAAGTAPLRGTFMGGLPYGGGGGVGLGAGAGGAVSDQVLGADRKAAGEAAPGGGGLGDILKSLGGVRGLTSIAGGLMGYLANQKAQQQAEDIGNQIKAAYQQAAESTRALAQPYITAGTPQLGMALQGALGPAQMQQYQAQQAQLAQAAARTGGVGAIQTAAAEQQMYQRALQEQQAMALQLLAPGNELLSQAINQELSGTTQGLGTTLQYQTMANEAAAKLFQNLGSFGAQTPQSQTNPGVQ